MFPLQETRKLYTIASWGASGDEFLEVPQFFSGTPSIDSPSARFRAALSLYFRKSSALHGGPSVVNVANSQCCHFQYPISIGAGNIGIGNTSTLATFSSVSRRPASASASSRVPRWRSPPSQLSSSASPPSNFGPPALRSEITLRTKSPKVPRGPNGRDALPRVRCGGQGLAALPVAIQGRGARSGRERRSESWLGAQTPTRPHGEADADAGRRGTTAPRRTRAADASQAASATSVFAPVPDRAHAERARDNHRESAADSRKQAKRPAQGARTAKRQGVTAISRLPNPRDARRNAHHAPSRRAPGIGRTYTTHYTLHTTHDT